MEKNKLIILMLKAFYKFLVQCSAFHSKTEYWKLKNSPTTTKKAKILAARLPDVFFKKPPPKYSKLFPSLIMRQSCNDTRPATDVFKRLIFFIDFLCPPFLIEF